MLVERNGCGHTGCRGRHRGGVIYASAVMRHSKLILCIGCQSTEHPRGGTGRGGIHCPCGSTLYTVFHIPGRLIATCTPYNLYHCVATRNHLHQRCRTCCGNETVLFVECDGGTVGACVTVAAHAVGRSVLRGVLIAVNSHGA